MDTKGIIFDLDGTLLNSIGDLTDATNMLLESLKMAPLDEPTVQSYVGNGVTKLVERILPDSMKDMNTVRAQKQTFIELYRAICIRRTEPYSGIPALLDELTQHGIPFSILSNKDDDLTRYIVSELLGKWNFVTVIGAKEGRPKKPAPDVPLEIAEEMKLSPENLFFVGDSDADMKAAIGAGMVPVGVSWGFRDSRHLHDAGARHVIDNPAELLTILG